MKKMKAAENKKNEAALVKEEKHKREKTQQH